MYYPGVCVSVHIYVNVFKSLYFSNHWMDMIQICYDDRYRSKVSFSNTPVWPLGHVGSKIRSPGQILEKTCVHIREHSLDPLFMKH